MPMDNDQQDPETGTADSMSGPQTAEAAQADTAADRRSRHEWREPPVNRAPARQASMVVADGRQM